MNKSILSNIPVFKLYGENHLWPNSDPIHCEMIKDKSSTLDWHIPKHRHSGLIHLVYVKKGNVDFYFEDTKHTISTPTILIIPAMTIHGFDLEKNTHGYSIAVLNSLMSNLFEGIPYINNLINN